MAADDPQKKVGKRAYSAIGSRLIAIRELAQLVERHPYKVDVASSSLAAPIQDTISRVWLIFRIPLLASFYINFRIVPLS